ncbi:MAG TPA: GNAT family protein [Solirubrobacteraceae bacterium]
MDGLEHLTYPLRTERLLLRPFEAGDLDAARAIWSQPDTVRYLYFDAHDEDAARARLGRKMTARPDDIAFAAVEAATGALVADLNIVRTSREHNQGEIGYIVAPAHAGRGYATEAGRVLLRLAFEALRFHRVVGRLDARNAASARVLEKLGMRREAHLIENERVKGEWTDELVYALLRTEWAAATPA